MASTCFSRLGRGATAGQESLCPTMRRSHQIRGFYHFVTKPGARPSWAETRRPVGTIDRAGFIRSGPGATADRRQAPPSV